MVVVLTDSSNSSAGGVVGPAGDSSDLCSSTKSTTSTTTASPEKDPARNLTHAFEALCLGRNDEEEGDDDAAALKGPPTQSVISPTSVVAELHSNRDLRAPPPRGAPASPAATTMAPGLELHPDLKRELTQQQVNRVSFYAILHDINKEALAMAANDALSQVPDPAEEEHSPLVLAAGVAPAASSAAGVVADQAPSNATNKEAATGMDMSVALIDEEEWLLSTIASRKDTTRPCPATFHQAMGEKEYENPVSSLAGGSRTQLWKPSRSWWEAKSGKNPWIEPTSHNKRWRYLWPLIHYHKFLAKCIKKLKRNGVDVKHSVSPVAVFLREEVCAVSDHLAALSLFDSDEWMKCLSHFRGWADPDDEDLLREAVAKLKLRTLTDVADVDSALLRSQIDEHFLQSMASARAQLREAATVAIVNKKPGQPPVYPRSPIPKQIVEKRRWPAASSTGYPHQPQPPPMGPPHAQQPGWWRHSWDPSQQHPPARQQQPVPPSSNPYCDNSSVHSALSVDTGLASYHQHHPMYPPHQYYYPPGTDNSWAHSSMMYMHPHQAYYPVNPHSDLPEGFAAQSPEEEKADSPTKLDDITASPFWSHLDQASLAMIATPAKSSQPFSTPRKQKNNAGVSAQPLLLQQQHHLHQQYYGQVLYDGYGPPSPATQFMMSPQANYFSYYGSSPGKNKDRSPRKPSASPCTVGTAESESQS